jgi:hypothetical protein
VGLIPATANLAALHLVIQALYGWDGDHLHAFRVRRATYSDPSFSLKETRDEYAMRVLTALNAGGGKITYDDDFGAGWIHEIALQEKSRCRRRRRESPAPAIRSAPSTAATHRWSTRTMTATRSSSPSRSTWKR